VLQRCRSDRLEIAEGLVELERKPQLAGQLTHRLRAEGTADQVRFEDLDRFESCCGGGAKFALQASA